MGTVRHIRPLQLLRQHRRGFALLMLGVMMIWLGAALVRCLFDMPAASPAANAAMVDMGSEPAVASMAPCAACTMGTESRSLDDLGVIPASPKLWSVLALVLVSALLAVNFPKRVPIPPLPLLPKRPRTLKFYALRI